MSDYLSRLVDRSLDRTEVIKPRLASFFEPSVQGAVFGTESGSERLDVSSASDETVYDDPQSVWRSDQTPQLKSAALQPAGSGSQQTPSQSQLDMSRQASSSVSPGVTAQSLGKTPQQRSSQDLPAPSGDETYVVSPGAAAERSRSSAHEPAIQPHGKTQPRASEPLTEEGDMHPARMMDQTPQLKSAALQPAGSGSQQTPSQPRSGMTRQASSSSSVSPEVTAQSLEKTPQQKSSQDLSAPSDDETYVVSPKAAAERSRSSAHEPAIQPITIEPSSSTSLEVTAQPSARKRAQHESDQEMLTPPSSGDGETYHLSSRVTAERNRESTREPASQPVAIERITSPEKTRMQVSEPAEPAVIRVTIGRIEVRATTPPLPPAPRARPRGPALTLDDYLNKRNGGQL
ncbi:MAG: hypothetical protein C5S48_08840 [Candidatus Methanogaster sp.]|nr:MAG: hypothetical protein C5S48_08840 [ANME-2 cluster archaeon]